MSNPLKKISPREAVCQYMGWSWDDLKDYRYHHGMTKTPIYGTSDGYVCAVGNGKTVPKADQEYITGDEGGRFVEASGTTAEWCKANGQTIWLFKAG